MIDLGFELSQTVVSLADQTRLWLLLRLKAPRIDDARRAPINLSLVMDRSGSMTGDKLAFCQQAARFLVNHLTPDDWFSLVTFDHEVNTPVPPTPMLQKDTVVRAILGLRPGGSTNLSGGWLQGAAYAEQQRLEGGINRVILLTDGLANAGVTDNDAIVRMTAGLADRGVTTTAIGCGVQFNEDLLRGMADAGHGNFHFIATPEDAPTIFHRELSELLAIYAQNLRLRVSPAEQVHHMTVLHDFPAREKGRDMEIALGDIFAGDEKVVLLEMVLHAGAAPQEAGVSTVHLGYQQVLGEVALREVSAFVSVSRSTDGSQNINPVVFREVLLCEAANALKEAIKDADAGHLEEARARLAETTRKLAASPWASEPQMEDQIQKILDLQKQYRDPDQYRTMGRKSTSSLSFQTMRQKGRGGRTLTPELQAIMRARRVVMIVGERLATTCGIISAAETFENYSSETLMRAETFAADPVRVWRWFQARQRSLSQAHPGLGHAVLAQLQHRWPSVTVVAISTDTLLEDAGCTDVLYMYGKIWEARCPADGTRLDLRARSQQPSVDSRGLPTCPACGSLLRPGVPWIGEALDPLAVARLRQELKQADALVIVATRNLGEALGLDADTLNVPVRLVIGADADDPHQAVRDFAASLAGY